MDRSLRQPQQQVPPQSAEQNVMAPPPPKKAKRGDGDGGGGAGGAVSTSVDASARTTTTITTAATTSMASLSSLSKTQLQAILFHCQHEVELLRVELDHERTNRMVQQQRTMQSQQRWQQQLQWAQQESAQAKHDLDTERTRSQELIHHLQQTRDQALQEIRQLHLQQIQQEQDADGDDDGEDEEEDDEQEGHHHHHHRPSSGNARLWQQKCRLLQEQLDRQNEMEQAMRKEMQDMQRDLHQRWKEQCDKAPNMISNTTDAGSDIERGSVVDEAPLAILKELSRVRLERADVERQCRQLQHQIDRMDSRYQQLLQEKEHATLQARRVSQLQQSQTSLQQELEHHMAQYQAWQSFGQTLMKHLHSLGGGGSSSSSSSNSSSSSIQVSSNNTGKPSLLSTLYDEAVQKRAQDKMDNTEKDAHCMVLPPEMSLVLRIWQGAEQRVSAAEQQVKAFKGTIQELRTAGEQDRAALQELRQQELQWQHERLRLQQAVDTAQGLAETLQLQQGIDKREADSYRTLLQSLDALPLRVPTNVKPSQQQQQKALLASAKLDANALTLRVTLETTKQRLELAQKEKAKLQIDLTEQLKTQQGLQQELDRVKTKFVQLRDALQTEKAKVQEAEERAHQAEALAGKGGFHPDRTRVFHMTETPLIEALKEEIAVLKRQLEVLQNKKQQQKEGEAQQQQAASSSSAALAPDPDKLNRRLKENFKEQIGLFREGVYLMTGFKVDMLPGTTEQQRPTFRVRSVYAEQESDHLLLSWPKSRTNGPDDVSTLNLLQTEWATALAKTPAYDCIQKFQSVPAFLASVQLSLFGKQTVMG